MPVKKIDQENEWEIRKTFKYNSALQYLDLYNEVKRIQKKISYPCQQNKSP